MKFFRDNFAYIVLGAVAVTLIFITLSLQASILSTQEAATSGGLFVSLRQQLATWIAPDDVASNSASVDTPETIASVEDRSSQPLPAVALPAVGLPTGGVADNNDLTVDSAAATGSQPVADNVAGETAITGLAPVGLIGQASVLYNAENITVSEDDEILASIISNNAMAVGFFGYAYYLEHQDRLRAVTIRLPDGQLVAPNATSVANGLYPLARPLFLYTSPTVMRDNPEVELFIGCYLNQLPQVVSDVGYLLPSRALFDQANQSFNASCQRCRRESTGSHPLATNVPACDLSGSSGGSLTIVGSSTVKPLSDRMVKMFTERGFNGTIEVDGSGTSAGFRNFCEENRGDIVDASRPVKGEERVACNAQNRSLIPFPIAVDALAIVVNRDNTFLQEASIEELQQIFAYAGRWSDVNAAWPNESILRAIPGAQSGTFDYFVEAVMDGQALSNLAANQANPLSDASVVLDTFAPSTPTSTPVGSGVFINNQPDVRLGYVERGDLCATNTALAALVLERKFGLKVTTIAYPDVDALFKALSAKEISERVDLTFCYIDPTDRSYRQRYFGYTEFIGSGYQQLDSQRYVLTSSSAVKTSLERSNGCLYKALTTLNWNSIDLTGQDVVAWYEANLPTVDSWTNCE